MVRPLSYKEMAREAVICVLPGSFTEYGRDKSNPVDKGHSEWLLRVQAQQKQAQAEGEKKE